MAKSVRIVNGYRLIYLPKHPARMRNANWDGYVYEHIVVVEKHLKRRLRKDEVVHHLDDNRANNRWANLLVLMRSQHGKLHAWLAAGAPGFESNRQNRVNSVKSKAVEPRYCLVCNKCLDLNQTACCSIACASANKLRAGMAGMPGYRKVVWPTKKQLATEMAFLSWCAIGRKYGVSDSAVRKWAKRYKLLRQR